MTYYELLEISEDASVEVVKAAYKALVKKYHPDNCNKSGLDLEKCMVEINEAYRVLSNDTERKKYDQSLKISRESQRAEFRSTQKADEVNYTNDNENNIASKPAGRFGKFIKSVGREFADAVQRNCQEVDNAFIEGMEMNERILVKKFKNSKGYKRLGYAQALEKKGLLEKDEDGKYVPTYRFNMYR